MQEMIYFAAKTAPLTPRIHGIYRPLCTGKVLTELAKNFWVFLPELKTPYLRARACQQILPASGVITGPTVAWVMQGGTPAPLWCAGRSTASRAGRTIYRHLSRYLKIAGIRLSYPNQALADLACYGDDQEFDTWAGALLECGAKVHGALALTGKKVSGSKRLAALA